jgi:hypothetical protein
MAKVVLSVDLGESGKDMLMARELLKSMGITVESFILQADLGEMELEAALERVLPLSDRFPGAAISLEETNG